MALSESASDFWIAAAAAAPVIALAGLVSLPDAAVSGSILKQAKTDDQQLLRQVTRGLQLIGPPNGWVIIYGIFNLFAQGFVLIVALLALLYDGTPIPGISVIIVEGVGLLALLIAALLAGQVSAARKRLEDERQRQRETKRTDDVRNLSEAIEAKLNQLASKPSGEANAQPAKGQG
jgi:hypothetical protein